MKSLFFLHEGQDCSFHTYLVSPCHSLFDGLLAQLFGYLLIWLVPVPSPCWKVFLFLKSHLSTLISLKWVVRKFQTQFQTLTRFIKLRQFLMKWLSVQWSLRHNIKILELGSCPHLYCSFELGLRVSKPGTKLPSDNQKKKISLLFKCIFMCLGI